MNTQILVETSARHIHLSQSDLEVLFGADAKLTVKKELSQPGQFASGERVTMVGSKGEMALTILGPLRPETQVELSLTDARSVGIVAPIRESGDIKGSAGCKLVGPCGELELAEGVIIAKRHIHMSPQQAEQFNVKDKQIVGVKVETEHRTTIFADVSIRVADNYTLAMHIDTDESNAAGCSGVVYGVIV